MPRRVDIRIRQGFSTEWAAADPVLDAGEPGYDKTNLVLKIGDGVRPWSALPAPAGSGTGTGGNITASQITDATLLGIELLQGVDAASVRGLINAKAGDWVPAWTDVTGKPTTFTPSAHTHVVTDVTGLQADLDAKADVSALASYALSTDLTTGLAAKADSTALAAYALETDLTSGLSGKSDVGHTHVEADVTGLVTALAGKQNTTDPIAASRLSGVVSPANLGTGTPSTTTVLLGDGTWGALPASGITSVNGYTTPSVTLAASDVGALPSTYVPDWGSITSKPSTFPPAAHTHPESDVVGLATSLAGKADTVHTHTSSQITDASTVGVSVLTAIDAPAARTAIGAGTSNLALGTTAATALAGNTTADQIGGVLTTRTVAGHALSADVSLVKADVGLGSVDNTSDLAKPISTATQTALNAKEPSISAGTVAQYFRGDKTWVTLDKSAVGLSNVDNTSDLTKFTNTALTGAPTAPTPLTADSSTKIATTAYVQAQGYETTSHASATYAPLASAALTGTPTAPTPTAGDNTTKISTTAFVTAAIAANAGTVVHAGTTGTAAATAAKTATISGYTPAAGDRLDLTLTLGNIVGAVTLNINGGGAVGVYIGGAVVDVTQVFSGTNAVWALKYDGTHWNLIGAQSNFTTASTAEMQAGVATSIRWMNASLVAAAIKAQTAILTSTSQSGTTYTFALTDAGTRVEGSNAAATTFTIPLNSSVAFPVGSWIEIQQYGGQITIAPAAGVTLRTPSSTTTRALYSTIRLFKRATDEWILSGDLT